MCLGPNELNKSLLNELMNVSVYEIMDDYCLKDFKMSIKNANFPACEDFV